jgi:uncharacterized protein YxeA
VAQPQAKVYVSEGVVTQVDVWADGAWRSANYVEIDDSEYQVEQYEESMLFKQDYYAELSYA